MKLIKHPQFTCEAYSGKFVWHVVEVTLFGELYLSLQQEIKERL